jgi:lysophospholipid acyltransferase (LPLAT)-like uncharacterized protein
VPKPFATIAMVIGEPMYVPPDDGEATLEQARVELETRLHALESRARAILQAG